jgi:predicted DNA-binding protein (UPF0251 family)
MKENTPENRFLLLTDREKEVFRLVCQHKSYQQIADELFISKSTVKTHMHNAYAKLGIDDLERDKRILKIHQVFSPLFKKKSEIKRETRALKVIDLTPEPEPLAPEKEKIIDDDETALITYSPQKKNGGKEKMTTKNKRGCSKFIIVLLMGVALTLGVLYGWQFVKDHPIAAAIMQLINPDAIVDSSPSAPSSAGSQPSESSTAETIIQSILPQTHQYGDMYEMNEWAVQDDVWVRLFNYEIARNYIRIDFEIWNKTGQEIYFSWTPPQNFAMTDNKNTRYEIAGTSTFKETIKNNERQHITGQGGITIQFADDPVFEQGVTDLYVTMEYFSKIDNAVFHIALNN